MEQLLKQQKSDSLKIEKIRNAFKKDSAKRKTKEYLEIRLKTITDIWAEFEKRHDLLEPYEEQFPGTEYFVTNFFAKVEALYEETRDLLEEAITAIIDRSRNTERLQEQMRRIKKQMALIDSLNRAISRIRTELDSQTTSAYFLQKMKLINDYWGLIITNHGEIMADGKFKDEYFDRNIITKVEDTYQEALIELQERLNKAEFKTHQKIEEKPVVGSDNERRTQVKLPRIDIPIFSGDYLKWQSFRDLFTELIHKDDKIAPAEKLFYLKQM